MNLLHQDASGHRSLPELRLILVGNIGCGKTLTADTLLGQSSCSSPLEASRLCEVRRGAAEGRRLALVETPRWYWSGQQLEDGVRRETEKALGLAAPGPHAFLILVPVGQFTDMDGRLPGQLERAFGPGALDHTIVLLTCGDYLLGRDRESYLRQETGLMTIVEKCGGRWHVINNRQPQDRQQVASLLEKVEQLVQRNGDCYLQSAIQRKVEAHVEEKQQEVQRKYSLFEEEKVESDHNRPAYSSLSGETWREELGRVEGVGERRITRSREEKQEVTSQHLANGVHSLPSLWEQETDVGGYKQPLRSSSFKLNKEGAILSQMSELADVKSNQNFISSIHHHITTSNDASPTTPSTFHSTFASAASSSPSSSSPPTIATSARPTEEQEQLRLVLLGRSGSGKSTAGNAILGREEFKLRRAGTFGSTTKQCGRGTATITGKRVEVVDTPPWLWSDCSAEESQAHLSSCLALSAPGPHAFLLCTPITHAAHSTLHALAHVEAAFGPGSVRRRTVVLFTHADLVEDGGAEAYVAAKRPEILELVEKCGDRYHVLEQGWSVKELMGKVEQAVKEGGGSFLSCQPQPECGKPWGQEVAAAERATPFRRDRRGVERLVEVDRGISGTLHSLREAEEEEDGEQEAGRQREGVEKSRKLEEPGSSSSSSSWVWSFLGSVGRMVSSGAKRVPKPIAGGALLGGAVGLFYGGPLGGAVGATAGSVAAEVGRRKYTKSKTD